MDFEAQYMFDSCGCGLCEKIHQLLREGFITSGGWCDPRRYYTESDEEFIKRVPDGYLRWPKEHKDIRRPHSRLYGPIPDWLNTTITE